MADLVLLHGFTQTGASWDGVRAALPPGLAVRAPDLRGHGAAADARPVDLPAVLADLDPLIATGATVAGYSMGGRIALHLAFAHPGRLGRLVLIGASPGVADPVERAERRDADQALAGRIEAGTIEAFADEWGRSALWAGQPPEVAAAARADRLRNAPAGLAAALRGLGTGALPSLWDRLPELGTLRVDLVAGERDAKFRVIAEAMAERVSGARTHVVAGAGHAAHLERSGAVARILAEGAG